MAPRLNRNRFRYSSILNVDDVIDLESLLVYFNQHYGSPLPTVEDKKKAGAATKKFFESYPDAEWSALTDLVTWAKSKRGRRRYSGAELAQSWRYAYQDGFMLILQRGGTNNDAELATLLENVSDDEVRTQMINAPSATARSYIYHTYLSSLKSESEPTVIRFGDEESHPAAVEGQTVRIEAGSKHQYGIVSKVLDNKLEVRVNYDTVVVPFDAVKFRIDGAWSSYDRD